MTREEEIQKLIDEENGIDNYGSADYQVGVCDGVRLADKTLIESLWHDKNEEPQEDGWVLVQFDNDVYDTISLPKFVDVFHDFVEMHNFIRWAYIKDLLPKGGEK